MRYQIHGGVITECNVISFMVEVDNIPSESESCPLSALPPSSD